MKKFLSILFVFFASTMVIMAQNVKPMKIVTNNPDFKIKVTRCVASGKSLVIDMLLYNNSTTDYYLHLNSNSNTHDHWGMLLYDDEGNVYGGAAKFANGEYTSWNDVPFVMLADVPTKLSLRFEGISVSTESVVKLVLPITCKKWGLSENIPVVLRNIPISR